MVGDQPSDVSAGLAFGARTVKIGPDVPGADVTVPDLAAGVDWILDQSGIPRAPAHRQANSDAR